MGVDESSLEHDIIRWGTLIASKSACKTFIAKPVLHPNTLKFTEMELFTQYKYVSHAK